ncbi:MAG: C45 family autoproteolytic acyltransferase/hydrolase [Anaerolineae bacterium]|jgi:predicted choloylglycine hydrolase
MSKIDQIEIQGSHYEIGLAIGQRFAHQIRRALANYSFLQERMLPYHDSPQGEERYQALLRLNRARYPDYVTELEGIAHGAGRPFEELFLANMRGEYRGYLRDQVRGCSDCALLTGDAALIGHNEDGSPAFEGNLYLTRARIEGKPAFTALSYPGFLCGHTFGYNAAGVCFSVDNVTPQVTKVGLGRHFLARSLLEARSLDDAVKRITVPGRASGFSYTIGSIPERRLVHVEVAPVAHHLHEIHGAYFHANHYLQLTDVEQVVSPSSQARVQRATEILQSAPPSDAEGILSLLGDQANERYPLYRTATPPDQDQTLCTVLFDLDARRLRIYTGHGSRAPDEFLDFSMA